MEESWGDPWISVVLFHFRGRRDGPETFVAHRQENPVGPTICKITPVETSVFEETRRKGLIRGKLMAWHYSDWEFELTGTSTLVLRQPK